MPHVDDNYLTIVAHVVEVSATIHFGQTVVVALACLTTVERQSAPTVARSCMVEGTIYIDGRDAGVTYNYNHTGLEYWKYWSHLSC